MAKNILPSISVIIPCHNYAHFLGDCLQSIIGQTYRPQEIIVVDDASTDEPNKIVEDFKYSDLRLIRVEHRSLVKSQREGILNANGEIVCCIDADDMIDPFYIQRGVETFLEDYRIGVVYSDMEFVGLMKGKTSFPESSLKYDIQRNNYIHSGSLVRREVALLTDAFEHPSLGDYTVDWFTWRKLLKAGYWAVKQPQRYIYRRHEESYSITRHWRPKEIPGYYESAALSEESITIALLANPTVQGWEKQRKLLEEQT